MKTLADRFRRHGQLLPPCLYRVLILAMADDLELGGITTEICRDWLDSPSAAIVQLRLLGGLHRLVLDGRAPQLVRYYPNLGGTESPAYCWPAFQNVLREHRDELRGELALAPQTNEPGRSVALLVGIIDAVGRSGLHRVRLLEVGASAGLNLLVDRFRIGGDGWASGPVDAPLRFSDAVIGSLKPVDYQIVWRRGCDLSPIDASTADGQRRLTSFVWPHDLHRHDRLRAALATAAAAAEAGQPVTVDRASAAEWLAGQLESPCPDGVLTIVWHSVTRQYWPLAEIQALDRVLAKAGPRMPIARVSMESPVSAADERRRGSRPAELTSWLSLPGRFTDPAPRLLGIVDDHGVPVTLAAAGQASD